MNPTSSGFPVHDPSRSFTSNPAAYPLSYPPPAAHHASAFDTAHLAALRQHTLSAPPETTYMQQQPSWMTAMGAPPFAQHPSPFESTALIRRPGSSMAVTRPQKPLDYSPASTLGRSPSGSGGGYGGLPDRPSEWRRDFSMRTGLASILPRTRQRSSLSYGGEHFIRDPHHQTSN
jgi:hypothetical protein